MSHVLGYRMKHLILGGTGTVGSAVVDGLLARNEAVRLLTRSRKSSGAREGVEYAVGDLSAPETVSEAFRGVDTVFLLNALSPSELQEGLFALEESRRAGVQRIVYLSVHDVEKGKRIPHFASKIAMEAAIRDSGIPFVSIRPNNFYQNDLLFIDVIRQYGVYPQPIGSQGISRVDVRDIADAAVNALTSSKFETQLIPVVGPAPLTGEDCARAYAEALGREVRYAGDDLDEWAAKVSGDMPPWMIYDLRLMYAMFQDVGLRATSDQLRKCEDAIGHPPRTFEAFVRESIAGPVD